MVSQVEPVRKSYSIDDQYEEELIKLFIDLFDHFFGELATRVGFYGMPHLGDFSLIERNFTSDGLAVLRTSEEDSMRYLFKAWRNLNPKRGLHFMNLYLRALIGDINYTTNQMYQHKSYPYPTFLRSEKSIIENGGTLDDYYLTSRIEVLVEIPVLDRRIISSIQTAAPARFTLDFRQTNYIGGGDSIGSSGGGSETWGTESGILVYGVLGSDVVAHFDGVMQP